MLLQKRPRSCPVQLIYKTNVSNCLQCLNVRKICLFIITIFLTWRIHSHWLWKERRGCLLLAVLSSPPCSLSCSPSLVEALFHLAHSLPRCTSIHWFVSAYLAPHKLIPCLHLSDWPSSHVTLFHWLSTSWLWKHSNCIPCVFAPSHFLDDILYCSYTEDLLLNQLECRHYLLAPFVLFLFIIKKFVLSDFPTVAFLYQIKICFVDKLLWYF